MSNKYYGQCKELNKYIHFSLSSLTQHTFLHITLHVLIYTILKKTFTKMPWQHPSFSSFIQRPQMVPWILRKNGDCIFLLSVIIHWLYTQLISNHLTYSHVIITPKFDEQITLTTSNFGLTKHSKVSNGQIDRQKEWRLYSFTWHTIYFTLHHIFSHNKHTQNWWSNHLNNIRFWSCQTNQGVKLSHTLLERMEVVYFYIL